MQEAHLAIREDPMGNIWGRWAGNDPSAGLVHTSTYNGCHAVLKKIKVGQTCATTLRAESRQNSAASQLHVVTFTLLWPVRHNLQKLSDLSEVIKVI